jgi:hypothetical protein
MSRNQNFVRKVIYIAALALLLLPLSALSQPATVSPNGQRQPGGKLAQLRERYNLAQARLGEIDPASETMKLASLGLRGVAANILWGQAHHYKKVEDWDKVEMTVNQIIRLQPNYLKVWDFQAHNLSYNISAEFDDYRMRYTWVKKGIAFLIEGTYYNRNEPGLLSEVGWYVGQKIGRSDEKAQFRAMFKEDKDFHQLFRDNGIEVDQTAAMGPGENPGPDNWLVSRLWYNKANDAVSSLGKPIRGMAPVLFYGRVPMSQINAADAMQRDGYFFQVAQEAWRKAAEEWRTYGDRELPTSAGFNVRMNDLEPIEQHIQELRAEIDKVASGLHTKLQEENKSRLTPEQRAALEKPADQRSVDERYAADYGGKVILPTPDEILSRTPREALPKVRGLVDQIRDDDRVVLEINRNRSIVAFEYWRTRVQAERTSEARQARKDVFDANKLFAQGEKFEEARQLYERAWDTWAVLFKRYPDLMGNAEAQDLIESISHYRDLLGQLDQPFPADFKLNDLLDMHYDGQQLREQIRLIQGSGSEATTPPKSEKGEKPTVEKPAADKPAADKPAADKPAADKPAADKPAADKPAEDKPAADKPAEDKPAAEKPESPAAAKP